MSSAPRPEHETVTWTYWLSRDSLDGALNTRCSLWSERPLRTRVDERISWTSISGHLGDFTPAEVLAWRAFKTYPATDRELIRVETRPAAEELAESRKGK